MSYGRRRMYPEYPNENENQMIRRGMTAHDPGFQHGNRPNRRPQGSRGRDDEMVFVLDQCTVNHISAATEENLRKKLETDQSWRLIADALHLDRDEQELLFQDSKRETHKTLTNLILQKWDSSDRSLGDLYRLFITKGSKKLARILKDGVFENLHEKDLLQKMQQGCPSTGDGVYQMQAVAAALPSHPVAPNMYPSYHGPPHGTVPPHGQQMLYQRLGNQPQAYPSHTQQPGRIANVPDYQQTQLSMNTGYPMHPPFDERGHQFSVDCPPPPYWSKDYCQGYSRSESRISQPESSIFPPSDYKMGDREAMEPVRHPGTHQMQSQGGNIVYPVDYTRQPGTEAARRVTYKSSNAEQSSLPPNYVSELSETSMPNSGMYDSRITTTFTNTHRGSLDSNKSYPSQTQPKELTQRSNRSSSVPSVSSDAPPLQNRMPSESSLLPCQSDDPSVHLQDTTSSTGQDVAGPKSVFGNPTAYDTEAAETTTDQSLFRKVLISSDSVETEPPGVSDIENLRKQREFQQDANTK